MAAADVRGLALAESGRYHPNIFGGVQARVWFPPLPD